MKKIIFATSVLFLASCNQRYAPTAQKIPEQGIVINGKLFATLFQQRAAEYRALCFQAFNMAREKVNSYKRSSDKPLAIVTDIDETVLNNSDYEAHQTLQGKDYESGSWYEWTDKASADTVPGAGSFLKYAASKGIEIFYITNRDERERASTIKNLTQFNLPNADDLHFLPKQSTSGKEPRRQKVAATHEIIMLLGDNLSDFSMLFDKKTSDERNQQVNNLAGQFGERFIIIPNPVYGDWESSLFNYNYKLTAAQKDSIIRASLRSY